MFSTAPIRAMGLRILFSANNHWQEIRALFRSPISSKYQSAPIGQRSIEIWTDCW
jgi:hypothetical protein